MNAKNIVKISNLIGIISIFLLLYWVFTFVSISVFDFKVFRENLTQTFAFSILGILALMSGALMLNIMFNLTIISSTKTNDHTPEKINYKSFKVASFLITFPMIFILLFAGDRLTKKRKKEMLLASATSVADAYKTSLVHYSNYSFRKPWLNETTDFLAIMSQTDKNYRNVSIIISDRYKDMPLYLEFSTYSNTYEILTPDKKAHYILDSSVEERQYLDKVFFNGYREELYSSHDGRYKLFYPYEINGKIFVLLFSDYQEYGKFGS